MKNILFTNNKRIIITIGLIGYLGWIIEIYRLFQYLKINKIKKFWNRNKNINLIIDNQKEFHSLAEINSIIEEMKKKKLNESYD